MQIYNSMTRKKEPFVPLHEGKVGIYACGPTGYNFFHIGNARPFIVFDVLRRYLDDIRRRLPQEDNNTMEDVEARIADIFRERLSSPMMVVSLASVQYAMEQLGQPDDFGECPSDRTGGCTGERIGEPEPAPRKLYRSRSDRAIAGICGGLADYLRVDPLVIRLLTLFLILFGGLSIWIYIILWLVVPEEPQSINTRK